MITHFESEDDPISVLASTIFAPFSKTWSRILDNATHHDRQDLVVVLRRNFNSVLRLPCSDLQESVNHLDKVIHSTRSAAVVCLNLDNRRSRTISSRDEHAFVAY